MLNCTGIQVLSQEKQPETTESPKQINHIRIRQTFNHDTSFSFQDKVMVMVFSRVACCATFVLARFALNADPPRFITQGSGLSTNNQGQFSVSFYL